MSPRNQHPASRGSGHGTSTGGKRGDAADPDDGGRSGRDTRSRSAGPALRFTTAEWDAFVVGAKDTEAR